LLVFKYNVDLQAYPLAFDVPELCEGLLGEFNSALNE
jgi:hypothetical protein